jgi:hypothetical protein
VGNTYVGGFNEMNMTDEELEAIASTEKFKAMLDDFADSAIELTQSIDAALANPRSSDTRKRLERLRPKLGVLARAVSLVMSEVKPRAVARFN